MVETTYLASGTIVDWVDRRTVPGSDVEVPPAPEVKLSPGVAAAELERLHGPEGALPFVRPALAPYIDGKSSARNVEEYIASMPHGNPNAQLERLYVTMSKTVTNKGMSAYVNSQWNGGDANDWPSAPDFVVAELASWCPGALTPVNDLVGIIVGRYPALTAGYSFQIEYASGGTFYWVNVTPGEYNQVSTTFAPGTQISSTFTSVPNGVQYESKLTMQYVSHPPVPPQWWFYHQGDAIGYISTASAFSSTQLDTAGCRADFYGEAYDEGSDSAIWMDADMGSGVKATTGTQATLFGTRAYFRRPGYYTGSNGAGFTTTNAPATKYDGECYFGKRTTDGGSDWNPTLFFGGPGHDDPDCL